ncbi:MAG: histidine phosphatase family protein [Mesorhizobium sp.]|nr:histidine phosphatase family protein [Mesorhizobium sp.]MBN9245683.1 histidine phosphatase family protein [Mesorhizobium sp.]
MQTRLTLVCSGVTSAVRRGAFPVDEALDAKASEAAAVLKPALARADRVLAGPERRTLQTAAALMLEAVPAEALRDQDFGRWAGKSLDDVGQAEPQALAAWLVDPAARPGGGESFSEVTDRVAGWLERLRGEPGHTVAVTHAAVVRATILAVLGAPPACFARIDVTPFSFTDLRGDGRRWVLRATGLTAR